MANYQYTADLVTDILWRAGEATGSAGARTSDFATVALQYVNRAYQAVWMGGAEIDPHIQEEWAWLRKDPAGLLSLLPVLTTGTVQVTNANTAIVFSSAPTLDLDNYFFQVDGHADVFRIATHTAADVNATLDQAYTGSTNATATYKAFKLEYTLASDVLRLLSPMRVFQENRSEIEGVPLSELERRWPLRLVESGIPETFALITESKVRFNRYGLTTSTEYARIEYDYLYKPAALTDSGSEEPVVPAQYRKTLADTAAYFLFLDKNDNRADAAGLMAKAGLNAMARENRSRMAKMSRTLGRIFPRPQTLPEHFAPLRTESGLIIG